MVDSARLAVLPSSLEARVERLATLDLRSIPLPAELDSATARVAVEPPADMYQHETGTSQHAPLLTAEGEKYLFSLMNRLKAQASQLRARKNLNIAQVEELERMWQEIQETRSRILNANVRLVIGLAHRFAPTTESVDDLISEGNLIMINAIDKFDCNRGFRFSTYATHAVQRHFFRLIQRRQRRRQRETFAPAEILANVSAPDSDEPLYNPRVAQELIQRFQGCLNHRERVIIEHRFGLTGTSSETLKSVAEKVGLSKERVRQLQLSAIAKLQDLASQLHMHPETCV